MHSGHLCLEFPESVSWESFPAFATRLTARIGASVTDRIDTAALRLWSLERNGVKLRLVCQDYPSEVSLESPSAEGDEQIRQIAGLLSPPHS